MGGSGIYKVSIETHFSSAHNLRGYKGKCEALHGHNWKVKITVSSEKLDSLGMVMDFTELKKIAGELMEQLDHKYLNEIPPFDQLNPSSENLAKYLFDSISARLKSDGPSVSEVDVWESHGSCATYSE